MSWRAAVFIGSRVHVQWNNFAVVYNQFCIWIISTKLYWNQIQSKPEDKLYFQLRDISQKLDLRQVLFYCTLNQTKSVSTHRLKTYFICFQPILCVSFNYPQCGGIHRRCCARVRVWIQMPLQYCTQGFVTFERGNIHTYFITRYKCVIIDLSK